MKKKKPGRPPVEGKPLTARKEIRFTPEQKKVIDAAGTADQWRLWMLDLAKAKIGQTAAGAAVYNQEYQPSGGSNDEAAG